MLNVYLPFLSFLHFDRKTSDGARQIRCTPDWGENAVSGDHLWVSTSFSSEACYLGESDCTVSFHN